MRPDLKDLLVAESENFGAKISPEQIDLFDRYLSLILQYNQKLNLTGIGDEDGIVIKHFIDSLSAARFLDKDRMVLDIGSGMGCPGIALKIAEPGLRMILLESNHKKCAFINQVARTLQLGNTRAVAERAEGARPLADLAGRVDAVLARALGKLSLLAGMAGPYLKPGGKLIAYKGVNVESELLEFKSGKSGRGFVHSGTFDYNLPFNSGARKLLVLEKV
jgi:16S rRNA (guanine527-N7)-methyltransferase